MPTPQDSMLGREVAYPRRYDPTLLFPIPRAAAREALGIATPLPFEGHDRWHAYELSWLEADGRPVAETATFTVPADSPNLVESKSLKLYLNSLNSERLDGRDAVRARITDDLSAAAGAPVLVAFGLPPVDAKADAHESIDGTEVADGFAATEGPDASLLSANAGDETAEALCSALMKSNCPVTGQPDWATLRLAYRGPRIGRAGLLRYLVSFREHAGFHEQCVEQVFRDVLARCAPASLSVEARFTRRGGLDINPWRATPGVPPPRPGRDPRQ